MSVLSNAGLEGGGAGKAPRLAAVDAARGVAVVAMVIYHVSWDLSELRLVATEVTAEPGWRLFARAIASTFLVLVGIGLVLAHGRGIRWRLFLRREAVVAGAALLVTIGTVFAFPDSYIFFGVLHCIALSSLLALPFCRLPAPAALGAAALVWIAPLVLTQAIFDPPVLSFLGLGTRIPTTNDWVPVFPWAGFVLAGVAAAKLAARLGLSDRQRAGSGRLAWPLAIVGRHSLIVYLLHQPILFGCLFGLVQITGPNPGAMATRFGQRLTENCGELGYPAEVCRKTTSCTQAGLDGAGLRTAIVRGGGLMPDEAERLGDLAQGCLAQSRQGNGR